jgi:hypothetical protein
LQTSEQLPTTCQEDTTQDKMDSSDSHSDIQGSEEGLSMDKLRREIAKAVGTTVVGVNLQVITAPLIPSEGHTGPTAPPEEYIPQCTLIIESCWEYLSQANYNKLERALYKTMPTLRRCANTPGPYQNTAANLAVQAKIMQISLANRSLNFIERETHCIEAIHFARLSGNQDLLALARYWYGDTFTYCYHQPQTAIDILNNVLSKLNNESSVFIRRAIYSDLSIAHAQIEDETNVKENEEMSREYAEMARLTIPTYPELDPLYKYVRVGSSELDQFEGKSCLYLAERTHNRRYAQLAHDAFDKSISKHPNGKGYLVQAYIRRADAARALGDMNGCVKDLADGFRVGVEIDSLIKLTQASDVIGRMPDEWKQETSVQKLQKAIIHTIEVRR